MSEVVDKEFSVHICFDIINRSNCGKRWYLSLKSIPIDNKLIILFRKEHQRIPYKVLLTHYGHHLANRGFDKPYIGIDRETFRQPRTQQIFKIFSSITNIFSNDDIDWFMRPLDKTKFDAIRKNRCHR